MVSGVLVNDRLQKIPSAEWSLPSTEVKVWLLAELLPAWDTVRIAFPYHSFHTPIVHLIILFSLYANTDQGASCPQMLTKNVHLGGPVMRNEEGNNWQLALRGQKNTAERYKSTSGLPTV